MTRITNVFTTQNRDISTLLWTASTIQSHVQCSHHSSPLREKFIKNLSLILQSNLRMKMNTMLLPLLLCSCLSALPPHMAKPSNYSDQQSLFAFKSSLLLDPFNALSDWSPNHTFCNWTGVICSSHRQRVVSLNLTGMGLLGPISPSLGNLSFLRLLDLRNNSFEGHIPYQLGRLHRLRVLRLSINNLEGRIPSSLGGCHSLRTL